MAYENIAIVSSNFCLTPQIGTFGTINTNNPTTTLRIKNTAGGLINEYSLSSNILNDVVSVEYVGPINLSGFIDDVEFFTLESIPDLDYYGVPTGGSSKCIIKRWELDVSSSLLNLKQQIVKYTTGNYYYDAAGMGVEHYNREFFNSHQGAINYIDINSTSRIETNHKLFLGPSTDIDNIGATETVTVSHISGDRVYINGNTKYQYVAGDQITFYNNIYLVSKLGYGGDTTQGTVFKFDAYTGSLKEYLNKGEYKNITAVRWSTVSDAVAVINSTQLLFIRPYDSYLNWRSLFLNNVESDSKTTVIPINDIIFDDHNVYKLMMKATYRDDDGTKRTYSWSTYNYQQDSLLPYTNSAIIYTDKAQLNGQEQDTDLNIQVRDQFNVALREVNVIVAAVGDPGALFTPLNGQAITDLNGKAIIGYTSGVDYSGLTNVTLRVDKSSPFTGSEYVWDMLRIKSDVSIYNYYTLFQEKSQSGDVGIKQIYDPYKNAHYKRVVPDGQSEIEITKPCIYLISYSYFSNEGGNWCQDTITAFQPQYWPLYVIAGVERTDAINSEGGGTWTWFPGEPPYEPGNTNPVRKPRPNMIFQLENFTQKKYKYTGDINRLRIKQPKDFWIYDYKEIDSNKEIEDGLPPDTLVKQIDAENDLQISQLKLSKHTHWVDNDPYDELFTNIKLDQFIFVSDAIPAFWSYKNNKDTYIWIRLRPFAFDLDGDSLRFYVRELWTEKDIHYDSMYYEVTPLGAVTYFDAGGGLLGVEFMYQPPQVFHHNALVYIHIEIYDTAPDSNFISVDYWFRIIPDYNSPYLVNMNPDREEDQVAIDKEIYFEIKDDGAGVDIDQLEVFLNSRMTIPTDITKMSDYHYKITCDLPYDLQFNKEYTVGVRVPDVSDQRNKLRDSYRFFTAESSEPLFTDFDPKLCKRGMPRFTDVSFAVLADGHGVDEDTIRVQVCDQDVTDESSILPIIYRIS